MHNGRYLTSEDISKCLPDRESVISALNDLENPTPLFIHNGRLFIGDGCEPPTQDTLGCCYNKIVTSVMRFVYSSKAASGREIVSTVKNDEKDESTFFLLGKIASLEELKKIVTERGLTKQGRFFVSSEDGDKARIVSLPEDFEELNPIHKSVPKDSPLENVGAMRIIEFQLCFRNLDNQ